MWWDDEKIKWYERASVSTDFHQKLASELEKHISKDERITELGCGLGYVSEILMQNGNDIISYDNDWNAIRKACQRTGMTEQFRFLDATTDEIPRSSCILMLFFGRLSENGNLHRYLKSADKIIYVISEHRGQNENLRKTEGEPEKTIDFLSKQKGIKWERVPFHADFSQPLDSLSDAQRYITRMYGNEKIDKYLRYLKKTEETYLLPNDKHISIFIITKEE